jgi:hypothetical protein
MKSHHRLIALVKKLADNNLESEARVLLAQVLQIYNIRDLQSITPDHPLYPLVSTLLRPGQGIQDKLLDFNKRLRVE